MNTFVIVVLLIAGGILAFSIWVRRPLRGTFDQLKPSGKFRGLILFGRDGAYVKFDQRSSGDHISFTKRFREDDTWTLEVSVSGPGVSATFLDEVKSGLTAVGDRFMVDSDSYEGGNQATFILTGPHLQDHDSLESVARLVIRHIGHPKNAKYHLNYPGPTDCEAVDRYFEKEKKKWKGEE